MRIKYSQPLDGKLVHTLNTPTSDDDFDQPAVNSYFKGKGSFIPTDVEQLDGLFYITTGYSNLDYVLTARIVSTNPFKITWNDLAFGGRGTGVGQFGTGHGITIPPGTKRLDIADRPNSEIDRYTRYGNYRSTLDLKDAAVTSPSQWIRRRGLPDGPDQQEGCADLYLENDNPSRHHAQGRSSLDQLHACPQRGPAYPATSTIIGHGTGDFAILEQVD
jgi:hypothetical protein